AYGAGYPGPVGVGREHLPRRQKGGPLSSSSPDVEAYQLMRAGRFAEALPFAEQAIARQSVCVPAHGMLARILLQLGRAEDAEAVVSRALQCEQGVADAYDALAHVSMLLGNHERSNA